MSNELKFSTNWNNKLSCTAFTTIRLKNEKYRKDELFDIILKTEKMGTARIMAVYSLLPEKLNEQVCLCDTGYSKAETIEIIRKMYKNIDFSITEIMVIVLKYEKKTAETNSTAS